MGTTWPTHGRSDAMLEAALVLLALAFAAAMYAALKLKAERDLARARLGDRERNDGQLRDTFQALASETLRTQSDQFLKLAEQKLAAREASAVGEMDKRRVAVDQLLAPIGESLKRTQEELRKIEKEREGAYSGLREQVKAIALQNEQVRGETAKLSQALASPTVRGRYGEIQLQRVAELAGMSAHCDFDMQATLRDGGRVQRPVTVLLDVWPAGMAAYRSSSTVQPIGRMPCGPSWAVRRVTSVVATMPGAWRRSSRHASTV